MNVSTFDTKNSVPTLGKGKPIRPAEKYEVFWRKQGVRSSRSHASHKNRGTLRLGQEIDEKHERSECKKAPFFEDDSQKTRQR